jgi:hypothetical protein
MVPSSLEKTHSESSDSPTLHIVSESPNRTLRAGIEAHYEGGLGTQE